MFTDSFLSTTFLKAVTNLMMIYESFVLLRALLVNQRHGGNGLTLFSIDDEKKEGRLPSSAFICCAVLQAQIEPNAGVVRMGSVWDLEKMVSVNLWGKVRYAKDCKLLSRVAHGHCDGTDMDPSSHGSVASKSSISSTSTGSWQQ
jgi:hypothetical protein